MIIGAYFVSCDQEYENREYILLSVNKYINENRRQEDAFVSVKEEINDSLYLYRIKYGLFINEDNLR